MNRNPIRRIIEQVNEEASPEMKKVAVIFQRRAAHKKVIATLSAIENSGKAVRILSLIGRKAGREAFIRASKLGIPQVFTDNNKVYEMYPDGRTVIIANAHERDLENYYVKYKKGTVLHARK